MGGRYLGNLREAEGVVGSIREYLQTPSAKNDYKTHLQRANPGVKPHTP